MHIGRQLSQIFDRFWQCFKEVFEIFGCIEFSEAKSDRASGAVFVVGCGQECPRSVLSGRGRPLSEGADYG